ncbi:MAG TPA: two-component regulator propeller domain-containing protein [Anaerolineales bacterium]|nr:two-component regulator propeller domain-containing protein [Anaerolineales bacterium]
MKQNYHPLVLALIALVIASLACQAATNTTPAATQVPQQVETQEPVPTETPSQPAIEPATLESKGPGILCVGSGTGLTCLTEDGWKTYTKENSKLPNNYLSAGAVCPDGQLAIAHINGVVLFDGKAFKEIPETKNYSSSEGLACGANGEIWVAHFKGVSRYSNGQWTTYGSDKLASGESANDLVYDVKAAPDGKVWAITSRSVAMFENDQWTIYQEGQGFEGSRFFNALTIDAKGRPWAAHSNGLDVFENGEWQSIEKNDYNTPESLAVDAKGQVWLGTLTSGVFVFDGNTWTNHDRASEVLPSNHVTSISADSGGRVWLGTSYGLVVYDGADWQTLLMSNSDLSDNDIDFVLTTKDGPATLPALAEKPKGSLTGKLEKADGTPLADVKVEICVETLASSFSGETPCSDQPFFLSTKTNADGVFLIEDVPAGYYVIVAETGDGWAQLTDQVGISSERTLIQAGEKYDIKTLTLDDDK